MEKSACVDNATFKDYFVGKTARGKIRSGWELQRGKIITCEVKEK